MQIHELPVQAWAVMPQHHFRSISHPTLQTGAPVAWD